MPALPARTRYGPGIAAAILVASMLLPPVAAYARQYAYAQALQFLIFAVAGPALLVLGTPWRSRPPAWRPGSGGRSRRPGGRAAIRLVAFIAVVISWRFPVTVNALARNPALVAAEMVALLAAGTGVWLELVSTPTVPSQLPRPARAAMAVAAMWTIWILAYLTGMSGASWFAAYHHGAPASLSAARHLPHGHRLAGQYRQPRREREPGRIVQHACRLASPAPRLAFTAHPAVKTFQALAPSG